MMLQQLIIVGHVAGPQGQVVTQQLHNERRVLVRVLRERVELRDGVVKGLLGQGAGLVGRVEDFVVEHREVECQTEADRVSGWQFRIGNIRRRLVGHKRLLCGFFALVTSGKLGQVAMVVTFHLEVEDL